MTGRIGSLLMMTLPAVGPTVRPCGEGSVGAAGVPAAGPAALQGYPPSFWALLAVVLVLGGALAYVSLKRRRSGAGALSAVGPGPQPQGLTAEAALNVIHAIDLSLARGGPAGETLDAMLFQLCSALQAPGAAVFAAVEGATSVVASRGLDVFLRSPPAIGELSRAVRSQLSGAPRSFLQVVRLAPAGAIPWPEAGSPAWLGFWLLACQEVVGMLAVASAEAESPRPIEAAIGTSVAARAACAIERDRFRESLKASSREPEHAETPPAEAQGLDAVGQWVSEVAHELNNPLATIMGYAQLIELQFTDAQATASAHQIAEAAARARAIVQKLQARARGSPKDS